VSGNHLTESGFRKCTSYKASLNKGLNPTQTKHLPDIIPAARPHARLSVGINPYWLSGFTAGEGSFMVVISKCPTSSTGLLVKAY